MKWGIYLNIFKKINLFEGKDDTKAIIRLEEKYLKVCNSNNVYSFQKKYYNQSKKLLKLFGRVDNKKLNTVRLIIVTDTHNALDEEELRKVITAHPNFDLCILLGDHNANDIEKIIKYIPREKILALLGNHDYDYISEYGLTNFSGKRVEVNGTTMMGIHGSFRYKPDNFPSFSQEESVSFLKDKEKVDILFSHDGPFRDDMINNPSHQGLFGITYYLFKNKVKYNIHGHLHFKNERELLNGTKEICLFGIEYMEIN